MLLAGRPADGVAVLRFRPGLWESRPEAYLAELYVRPERRGRGVGGRFLEEMLRRLREAGYGYVDLNTTEADVVARRLYERHGFDCHEGQGSGPLALYYELTLGEPVTYG
ncbi:GNAT family N-acetyltransferase [Rothia sp. AR01]|uniref:GNAT family N-acetyltransferase n=1 Tax=Rothia santali TaxID=2949643 RepID=A0A9X2HFU6_9MICC|nr:GNAT family N-acetyltransferase [Rothia santali]MCP3425987.1 GNAT family N-acetyltransferase [Rothia santali]